LLSFCKRLHRDRRRGRSPTADPNDALQDVPTGAAGRAATAAEASRTKRSWFVERVASQRLASALLLESGAQRKARPLPRSEISLTEFCSRSLTRIDPAEFSEAPVTDDGHGIGSAHRDRLFQPFFHHQGSEGRRRPGTSVASGNTCK